MISPQKLVSILLFFVWRTALANEVYFSPSKDCEDRIVRAIQDSKREIVVAVYSINNRKIADSLREAKQRGIKIEILTDAVQAAQKNSLALPLLNEGFNLRLHSKYKIEHNKFAVFDGSLVETGSFNWTGPASRSNSENCIFLKDAEVVKKYRNRFTFLWEKNTRDASLVKAKKLLKSRQLSTQ